MSERWQLTLRSIVDIFRQTTSLVNHLPSLGSLPLLLFLQFLGGFFPQQKLGVIMITDDLPVPSQLSAHPQFLLPLRGHETLLGLLTRGLGLQPGPHLGLLPVDLCLLLVVAHRESPVVTETQGNGQNTLECEFYIIMYLDNV